MLRENFLKQKLNSGQVVIGTWSIMSSPMVVDVIASAGVDFIIIDSEHGPVGFETAQSMAMVCESRQVSPVMRVSGINEAEILKALDIGCHCVQVPNVKSAQSVRQVVGFSKYPPIGERGFSPFTRAGQYSHETSPNYTGKANDNTLVAIHIEGKDAVDNIASIVAEPGLDIVFVGLFDLSKSLGIPGQVEHPSVMELLERVVSKASEHGKYVGTIATSHEQSVRYVDMGVKYITYSVDCEILSRSYRAITGRFKTRGACI